MVALRESGFGGAVYPVNPRGGEIEGLAVSPSVAALPEAPDLALVCRPAEVVPGVIAECGERGIGGAVVLAVGFGESGQEGRRLDEQLFAEARRFGVRILGPNTSGILNSHAGLNLIGWRRVRPGGVALLVQSGNIALDVGNEISSTTAEGISFCIGLGNRLDVGFAECLDFLGSDPATRVIVVHTEGIRDPARFVRVAARVARLKPVVAIRGGRSREGRVAAISHTGAVSSRHGLLGVGLRQAGVIEVERTDELVALACAFSRLDLSRGLGHSGTGNGGERDGAFAAEARENTEDGAAVEAIASGSIPRAIVSFREVGSWRSADPAASPSAGVLLLTDGGGQGTLAADLLSELRIPLAKLNPQTKQSLRGVLGRAAALDNPVDVAGAADRAPAVFARALELLARDPAVGVVLLIGLFGGYALRFSEDLAEEEERTAVAMASTARAAGLPLVVHSIYARSRPAALWPFVEAGVPVVGSLEVAVRCGAELWRRGELLDRPAWQPVADPNRWSSRDGSREVSEIRSAIQSDPIPAGTRLAHRRALSELDSYRLLTEFGVRFPPHVLCCSIHDLGQAAKELGFPMVLKAVSGHIAHKSEAGIVELGIESLEEAERAFRKISSRARSYSAEGRPKIPSARVRPGRAEAGHPRSHSAEGRPRIPSATNPLTDRRTGDPPERPGPGRSQTPSSWDSSLEELPDGSVAEIDGILAARMLTGEVAELMLGVRRDLVGPVLTIAAGGTWAEVMDDKAQRLLPVSDTELRAMIAELRIAPALAGFRAAPPADVGAVLEAAKSLVSFLMARGEVLEAEINPLFALPESAIAVDALVVVDAASDAPSRHPLA